MILPKELNDEIWDFCRLNNVTNIDDFKLKLIRQGFTIEKFGASPTTKTIEKVVEKPVEKIIEKVVEKIIEVPIEVTDIELNNKYHELMDNYKLLQEENKRLIDEMSELNKQLDIEKNKKDLYGER